HGQLGLGDTGNRGNQPDEMGDALPTVDLGTGHTADDLALGQGHTCALLDDGTVKCWGGNDYGQLGQGDDEPRGARRGQMGDALPPVDLGSGRTAVAVEAVTVGVCALLDDSSVKCWGAAGGRGDREPRGDEPGEMGDSLPPIDLGTGRTVRALSAGRGSVCALFDDGSIKCWGVNYYGQLGLGDEEARGDEPGEMGDALPQVDLGAGRTAVEVFAGGYTTCALLDDASLKCWGDNRVGQLGRSGASAIGDDPGEMGDRLAAVALGAGRTARTVALGESHTCAILDDGAAKCWGGNDQGQLGQGDETNRRDVAALTPIQFGSGPVAATVVAGADHNCVVFDGGAVKCWGDNTLGALGLGDERDRGDQTGEMGDALPIVDLVAGQHVRRPDLALKRDGGPWVGDDRYEGQLRNQRVGVRRERLGSVTFYLRLQNDGDRRERFTVLQMGGSEWQIRRRYFQGRSHENVTVDVLTGRYVTPPLEPGASTTIRIEVHVRRRARHDHLYGIPLRARVVGTDLPVDTVQAEITVH
ncbi:MAG: hypothetical protein KDB10_20990, partial [Acidimicrobiales bacterium]|nr:hypothetical protein [Acidimicrobiales bacterium]